MVAGVIVSSMRVNAQGQAMRRFAMVAALVGLGACSSSNPGAPTSAALMSWHLRISSVDGGTFSVLMRLDGRQVYDGTAMARATHDVQFQQPRERRTHTVEFQLVAARRAQYLAVASAAGDGRPGVELGFPQVAETGSTLTVEVED